LGKLLGGFDNKGALLSYVSAIQMFVSITDLQLTSPPNWTRCHY